MTTTEDTSPADPHPNFYGNKPLHDSDRIVTEQVVGRSGDSLHNVTHCKHCGCRMTQPVSQRKAVAR